MAFLKAWRSVYFLGSKGLRPDLMCRLVCACSYPKLAEDVKEGSQILCADGSIVLEVLDTDPKAGIVTCRCQNNAKLGYANAARYMSPAEGHIACASAEPADIGMRRQVL